MITVPTLTGMITHLASQMPQVFQMLTAISYVLGLFMMFGAIYKLKQYGDLRTMMSSSTDLRAPILGLVIGAAVLFLPSTFQVGMQTFFASNTPLAYNGGGDQTHTQLIEAIIEIMEVVGVFAVLRGLTLLARSGNQGQPGMLGKGITHLIAGIFAMNIYGVWTILENSLGFAVS